MVTVIVTVAEVVTLFVTVNGVVTVDGGRGGAPRQIIALPSANLTFVVVVLILFVVLLVLLLILFVILVLLGITEALFPREIIPRADANVAENKRGFWFCFILAAMEVGLCIGAAGMPSNDRRVDRFEVFGLRTVSTILLMTGVRASSISIKPSKKPP